MKKNEEKVSMRDNEKKTFVNEAVLDVNVVFDHEKIEQGLREWLKRNEFFYQRVTEDNRTVVVRRYGNVIGTTHPDDVVGFLESELYDLHYLEDSGLTDLMYLGMPDQEVKIQATRYNLESLYFTHEKQILNEKMFELLPIHDAPQLKDTEDAKFFFYANCVVKVTDEGVEFLKYDDLDGHFVWIENINKQSLPLTDDYEKVSHV